MNNARTEEIARQELEVLQDALENAEPGTEMYRELVKRIGEVMFELSQMGGVEKI